MASEEEMVRAARNEALYREVNERIRDLNVVFDEVASLGGTWVCECADPNCAEALELTLAEYESVRAHPDRFLIRRGHEVATVERIVEEHEQWAVVEKLGVAAQIAIERDPRTNGARPTDATATDDETADAVSK